MGEVADPIPADDFLRHTLHLKAAADELKILGARLEQPGREPPSLVSHLGGRAILDRKIIHVPDVLEDPEYSREFALAGGWRAVLAVPLMRDGIPLGALTAAKAEPE